MGTINKPEYIPLEFGEAVKICFSKYADFNGRASRSENWWFVLFSWSIGMITSFIDYSIAYDYYNSFWEYLSFSEWGFFNIVQLIVLFLPGLAVSIRRLHDVNRSGWNWLWAFTVIGLFPLLYWSIKAGDDEKNNYGMNPLKKAIDVEKPKYKKEAPKTDTDEISDQLKEYKQMLSDGLISEDDYNAKKKQILGI